MNVMSLIFALSGSHHCLKRWTERGRRASPVPTLPASHYSARNTVHYRSDSTMLSAQRENGSRLGGCRRRDIVDRVERHANLTAAFSRTIQDATFFSSTANISSCVVDSTYGLLSRSSIVDLTVYARLLPRRGHCTSDRLQFAFEKPCFNCGDKYTAIDGQTDIQRQGTSTQTRLFFVDCTTAMVT